MPNVTVKFEMSDGRTLECRYSYHVTLGNTSGPPERCYPDEYDASEPDYYINNKLVEITDLPKGLDVIAKQMYEVSENGPRFTYIEQQPEYDGPDYDPRDNYDY